MRGPAEQQFLAASRRYVALTRVVIALTVEGLALLVVPPGRTWSAAATLLGAAIWGATYLYLQRRRAQTWVIWCDAVVVSAACLAQPWLDVPYLVASDCGWLQMLLLIVMCAHQWQLPHTSNAALVAVVAVPVTAFTVGRALMTDPGWAGLLRAVWPAVLATISRALFRSIRTAARRVDEAAVRREHAKAEVAAAAARRAAMAEHFAALHDTAAATLMMIGLGHVADDAAWLSAQARSDLQALTGRRPQPTDDGMVAGLRSLIRSSGLSVSLAHVPTSAATRQPTRLPAEVEAAVLGAVGEALRNVTLHAGVGAAQIRLEHSGGGVRVEVRDNGRGFADGAKLPTRRGILHSIVHRMQRIGGRATVTSSESGVNVRLEWPDE